jgi:hypothetical protein
MNRLTTLAAMSAVLLSQGCATSTQVAHTAQAIPASAGVIPPSGEPTSSCVGSECAAVEVMRIAHKTEVPADKDAPAVQGHPLTSVVVTQCNLIVAVYLTMQDGRLMRFDSTANVPADQLLQMAYSATRSERVEVDCNNNGGAVGYEKHEPV